MEMTAQVHLVALARLSSKTAASRCIRQGEWRFCLAATIAMTRIGLQKRVYDASCFPTCRKSTQDPKDRQRKPVPRRGRGGQTVVVRLSACGCFAWHCGNCSSKLRLKTSCSTTSRHLPEQKQSVSWQLGRAQVAHSLAAAAAIL